VTALTVGDAAHPRLCPLLGADRDGLESVTVRLAVDVSSAVSTTSAVKADDRLCLAGVPARPPKLEQDG
jgi:hypothetical protein